MSLLKRLIVTLTFVGLVTCNFLTITNARFHEYAYDLLSYVPYEGLLENSPIKKIKAAKVAVHSVSNRITKRIIKNVGINVGSVVAEAVPFIGTATILVVTGLDIKDGCDNIRDAQEILKTLEIEDAENNENKVCGLELPKLD